MSSKVLQSPQSLNILQPRRLNANAAPAGNPIGGSPSLVQTGEGENHYGLASFTGKEAAASGTSPSTKTGSQLAGIPGNHGQAALFTMSASRLAKAGIGNPGQGKKGIVTMAKRNARERNRVKQVNQGFQTLRQHIPDSYRMKKMSKVDTLRCALEYIRSLEEVLEEFPGQFQDQGPGSSEDFSESSLTQHLDRICGTQIPDTGDQVQDQSQSFSYSEADDEDESCSFLQMTNSEIMDSENGSELKLKLEDSEQYITVMVPLISQGEPMPMSLNLNPSNSPPSSQLSDQIEFKLFGNETTNEI